MRCKEKIDELVHTPGNVLIRDLKFVIRDGPGERTIDGSDVFQYDKSYLYTVDAIKTSQIPYHRVRKILVKKDTCVWEKR